MIRRRRKNQSGSILVEFALWFTLLIMLGVSALSFGMAVQRSIMVADAANAGALYGANTSYGATDIAGMAQAVMNAGAGVPNLTAVASYWCKCSPTGSVVACTSACGTDQPIYYVQVTASATYPNFFRYLGLPATFTLQSVSIMQAQ
jgi:Flp pilus assembly protein TadG